MATYNLEQTPDVYISSRYTNNKFGYMMKRVNKHDSTSSHVGYIDLEKDKLFIYGIEIKEPTLQKLHDLLVTKPSGGKLYVNCNGECYVYVDEAKKNYSLFDRNVTFDWSTFGVMVPNSVYDVSTKQLRRKDDELQTLRSLQSANTTSFEALKQEAESLGKKLENSCKIQEDLELELQKVRKELSLKEFEFESKKIEIELSKDEVKGLQEQVSGSKKDQQSMEKELQTIRDQLSNSMKEKQETAMELQEVRDQLSKENVELRLTKSELESSRTRVLKLEEQLSSMMNDKEQSMKIMFEFIKIEDEDKSKSAVGECKTKVLEIVDELND